MTSWIRKNINGGASLRWSFGPLSAWGSIETTTILTTHPSLVLRDLPDVLSWPILWVTPGRQLSSWSKFRNATKLFQNYNLLLWWMVHFDVGKFWVYVQYIFAVYKYCNRRSVSLRSVSWMISILRSVIISTSEKMIFVFLGEYRSCAMFYQLVFFPLFTIFTKWPMRSKNH